MESFDIASLEVQSAGVDDVNFTCSVAERARARTVLVDGYHFEDEFRRDLRRRGLRIAAIDDFGGMQSADVIINANGYASLMDYQSSSTVEHFPVVLTGPSYALLRREFRQASEGNRQRGTGLNILVTCGGSDPTNATELILRELNEIDTSGIAVTVVVGGSFGRLAELKSLAATLQHPVELIQNCTDMPALMRMADVAIAAAGSTCWELASLGVPIIAVITADNQIRVAGSIEDLGLGWNLGAVASWHSGRLTRLVADLHRNRNVLTQYARAGSSVVDGLGAIRVANALSAPEVILRPATLDDSRQLWEWRNDETVRQVSFSTDPVPWENHCRWFTSRVDSPACRILIAQNAAGLPVGQVRLDVANSRATISISIAAEFRSGGFGRPMIRKATQLAFWQLGVNGVDAFIKADNIASQKVFQHCGYRLKTNADVVTSAGSGSEGLHYVFETGSTVAAAA